MRVQSGHGRPAVAGDGTAPGRVCESLAVARKRRDSDRGADPRAALGRAAEEAVARRLESLGWDLLARNVRLCGAEIDVVGRDGETIVFVEVRSRSRREHGGPLETVGPAKQARIARAATAFLARAGLFGDRKSVV